MKTKHYLSFLQNAVQTRSDSSSAQFILILALCSVLCALCPLPSALCQVPQGFNYQAIARDGSGNPITGATIKVKLSILSDTSGFYFGTGGTYIW